MAERASSGGGKRPAVGAGRLLRELVLMGAVVVLIWTFFAQAFDIPSSSMRPGLLTGDRIVAFKFAYGYSRYSLPFSPNLFSGRILGSEPRRGDVVVFRLPSNPKIDYIKRVIGLPGDRVRMAGGRLMVNGRTVERRALEIVMVEDGGAVRAYRVFDEALPDGPTYRIYHLRDSGVPGGDTPEYVVPAGHYFMMGDNRDNSCDSRFGAQFNPGGLCPQTVGFVPYANLVARSSFILFSTDGSAEFWEVWKWPFALRYGRFLGAIR